MKKLGVLLRGAGWQMVGATLTSIVAGLAFTALLRLIHEALTNATLARSRATEEFVGLVLAYFVFALISELLVGETAERLQWRLRLNLVAQMIHVPLRTMEKAGLSRLAGIVGGDVKVIADYLCWLPEALVNFVVVLGCLGYMAWLSPAVAAFNLVFLALAAVCYLLPEGASKRIARDAAAGWDRHVAQFFYFLQGFRGLLLSPAKRRDFFERHFSRTGLEVRALTVRRRRLHMFAERLAEVLVLGNVACLLFVLPRYFALTPAILTGLLLAALFARAPLKNMLDVLPRTHTAQLALERMHDVGLSPFRETSLLASPTGVQPAFEELALENVRFHYESDHGHEGFASGPYSLKISAGEIVFIVGGNGAGKTTLAKLLCGLYPPTQGSLCLNGRPVATEADREALRTCFSAVFTDDPLFTHLLGLEAERAEALGSDLMGKLRLDHKVSLKGTEFSTIDLSQGQRRRLLLLSAILDPSPILLLDEWAADQDPEFRSFFYEHLVPSLRARGRTLIVITHDDRYFERADRVIRLEAGRWAPLNEPTADESAAQASG